LPFFSSASWLIFYKEFLVRVKRKGDGDHYIGRRYGDFSRLYKKLRIELPGKVLPPMPKKNKSDSTTSVLMIAITGGNDSDVSSVSSSSTQLTGLSAVNGSVDNNISKHLTLTGKFLHVKVIDAIAYKARPPAKCLICIGRQHTSCFSGEVIYPGLVEPQKRSGTVRAVHRMASS
jgi:hypothetical protein